MADSHNSNPAPHIDVDAVSRKVDTALARIDRGEDHWLDWGTAILGRLALIEHQYGKEGVADFLDPNRYATLPPSEPDLHEAVTEPTNQPDSECRPDSD